MNSTASHRKTAVIKWILNEAQRLQLIALNRIFAEHRIVHETPNKQNVKTAFNTLAAECQLGSWFMDNKLNRL